MRSDAGAHQHRGAMRFKVKTQMRTLTLSILLVSARAATQEFAVAPQYDTAHVYVAPQDFDRFVTSLLATFGGTTSKPGRTLPCESPPSRSGFSGKC